MAYKSKFVKIVEPLLDQYEFYTQLLVRSGFHSSADETDNPLFHHLKKLPEKEWADGLLDYTVPIEVLQNIMRSYEPELGFFRNMRSRSFAMDMAKEYFKHLPTKNGRVDILDFYGITIDGMYHLLKVCLEKTQSLGIGFFESQHFEQFYIRDLMVQISVYIAKTDNKHHQFNESYKTRIREELEELLS